MNLALRFVFRLALGTWVGAIVAVSFLVAPTAFRLLPRESAGSVMGAVFGGYYLMGVVLGLVALAAVVALAARSRWDAGRWAAVLLLAGMIAAAAHNRWNVAPRIIDARGQLWQAQSGGADGTGALRERLDQLHHVSVMLNGAMLLMGVALIGLEARRENRLEEE